MPIDPFDDEHKNFTSPAYRAAAIVPNDGSDLSLVCRAIYVGGGGDIAVITAGGDAVTLKAAATGSIIPLALSRVKATGTTATNLLALW